MPQSIAPLIARKRDGLALSTREIGELITGVCDRSIPDYQIGAILMAIYLRGMTKRETADLTGAMVRSGETLDLSVIHGFKADKHSTGGVGDKVTVILGPLLASAGVFFPKLSGRGLGHTGGTLDKLESIPGFRVDLTIEEFIRQVQTIGLAINGQTDQLVPADAILYGLRDVTSTVASAPLIASSVMSKKIAAGADGVILDVKCGRGAFMSNRDEAVALARLMVSIGEAAGKRTAAVVTSMEAPLGRAVGNALEIKEAIATLRGEVGGELREVCLLLGARVLMMAGVANSVEAGQELLAERLSSGAGLEKLRQMIEWQGGDVRVIRQPDLLTRARKVVPAPSRKTGFVRSIDARQIGLAAMDLGAGRQVSGEAVDRAVGLVLRVQMGDRVEVGQSLAEIHTNGRIRNTDAIRKVRAAFEIGPEPPEPVPHVLDVVTA